MISRRIFLGLASAASLAMRPGAGRASNSAAGITDTEIKIGQTMPYSGPASGYGVIGRSEAAYFRMVNEQGGVNGRKLNLISLDDGYSPPKTVEQVRRLVEQEQVAFLFQMLGTPTNLAVRQYLNDNRVPQLFVSSGSSIFADPQRFPWTIPILQSYRSEGRIYAKHILATRTEAKIAVLYQNDDFGKDYLLGFKDGLGPERAGVIVEEASYETSDPTIDSQVVTLQGSGADVFLIVATQKFAAQAIRRSYDLGWSAVRYINNTAASTIGTLKPAGLDKSKGILTAGPQIDVTDPRYQDLPDVKAWKEFMAKYMTATDFSEGNAFFGYGAAATMVQVLRQCGDNLSRDNVMREAVSLKDYHAPHLLPGVTINLSPNDYRPIRQFQLGRFDGDHWEPIGDLLTD
jgi:branched-chain amino acid transport system substrate-binding protein